MTENLVAFAKECFQKALLQPSHTRSLTACCYEQLGYVAYYEERDLTKARDFLNRAVDTYPQTESSHWLVQVYILLSRVYKAIGDTDLALHAAEVALNTASAIDSGDKRLYSEALLNIGEISSEIEHRETETINYLQAFIQTTKRPIGIDVTWSRVNEMLGNAEFNLGHYDVAATAYMAALQLNPDHPWEVSLYHRLARCHYQKQSYQTVIEIIQELLNRTSYDYQSIGDYRIFDLLGNAQFAIQNYSEAMIAYEVAIQMAPVNTNYKIQIQSYLDIARELV